MEKLLCKLSIRPAFNTNTNFVSIPYLTYIADRPNINADTTHMTDVEGKHHVHANSHTVIILIWIFHLHIASQAQ